MKRAPAASRWFNRKIRDIVIARICSRQRNDHGVAIVRPGNFLWYGGSQRFADQINQQTRRREIPGTRCLLLSTEERALRRSDRERLKGPPEPDASD